MIDVFIAYSHSDLPYKDELKKFLRPLLREERISLWDDFDIEAGQDWDAKIKERLYGADLVLLLVSADSLASDYFYGKEVKVSLERHARGEAIVVPVILRHCDWTATPLGSLEALPEKGRPVVEWPTRDQAFQDITSRLRRVVQSLEQRRQNATADADALRQFQAACLAADHLYEKRNWREAALAYSSALAAYHPGFVPDQTTLLARQADCERQIRAEQTAEDQRMKEAKAAHVAEEKRNKAALAGEARRANEAAAQEQRALRAAAPPVGSSNRLIFFGIGIIGLLIITLLLWRHPWSPVEQIGHDQSTKSILPADTEAADFAAAKATGTLPGVRSFLKKEYPRGQFQNEAKQLAQTLEGKIKTLINDAAQFPDEPDTACDLLRQAAAIDPDNVQVLKKRREFKCK